MDPKPVTEITKDLTGVIKEIKPPKITGLREIVWSISGLIFFNKKKFGSKNKRP